MEYKLNRDTPAAKYRRKRRRICSQLHAQPALDTHNSIRRLRILPLEPPKHEPWQPQGQIGADVTFLVQQLALKPVAHTITPLATN